MAFIPQVIIIVFAPWLLLKVLRGSKVEKWLSPVVMSYVLGILIAMFSVIPLNEEINIRFSELSIMVAIPMLLFTADIKGWFKHAGPTVLSYLFAILAALISASVFAFLFRDKIPMVWQQSGMLVGVFTGGTANMQAVGLGVNASEETFVILNAAEILWGGIYLIFLTSIAHKVFGTFLPDYIYTEHEKEALSVQNGINYKTMGISALLSVVIVGISAGSAYLIYGSLSNTTYIILMLTSLSVLASFYRPIRTLESSFEGGEYLLLIFCVAIGMRSDFIELLKTGGTVILFTGCTMLLTIVIHLVLSKLFKIDRDTTIITSTAAIYGPAFIGQIASVMNNRQIIFAGMATGLVGYAVGNYLGIGLSEFLENYFTNMDANG